MNRPGSVLIQAYDHRALDAGSKANPATTKALAVAADTTQPPRRATTENRAVSTAAADSDGGAVAGSEPATNIGRRIPLVIGNSLQIRPGTAQFPQRCTFYRKSLPEIGFKLAENSDLDRTAMQAMTRRVAQAQVELVYHVGHGVQVDSRKVVGKFDCGGPDA